MQFSIVDCFCSLFSWLNVRSSTLLMLAGIMCTASLREWPLACCQSDDLILLVMLIFLFQIFIPLMFGCLSIVQKHFAQTLAP